MIPRGYIDAWREHAPWRSDAMVEQDLIICRSLVAIFSHPELSRLLAFRGGTALHKLFFRPPRRYSEDIDLVQLDPQPIGAVFNAIREALGPVLGEPQRKQGPGVVTLTYRMQSETSPVVPLRIKIEINTREHFTVFGVNRVPFLMASPWWSGTCDVPTYTLEELLGTKMRALYQRRKGRDLFDLWLGLTEGRAAPDKILTCFRQYMEHSGLRVTRRDFLDNLADKRSHPLFTADLSDLLPADTAFDNKTGLDLVERLLVSQL